MFLEVELKLKSDTSKRRRFFTAESFSHPAKLHLGLLEWIVFTYTSEGETILDPMFGSGTLLYATLMGRSVIGVELESKFVSMAEDNLKKLNQMPLYLGIKQRGNCQIMQGDARQLEGLVDRIVTSPPYAEQVQGSRHSDHQPEQRKRRLIKAGYDPKDYQLGKGRNCEVVWEYGKEKGQIGNLPYGQIDKIVTSPPYEGTFNEKQHTLSGIAKRDPKMRKEVGDYSGDKRVDSIITSPPYENQVHESVGGIQAREDSGEAAQKGYKKPGQLMPEGYSVDGANIGNLKSDTYLEAMLQVYQQCHKVLKPQGLMILVTKNFIRDKQVVRLDEDTIELCEQAGFNYIERHYRKLSAQSFWRTIYHQKYPEVEKIEHEDVLVFRK